MLAARIGFRVAQTTGATARDGSRRWSVKARARRCGCRTFASNRCAGARKAWWTFQATMYALSSESPT